MPYTLDDQMESFIDELKRYAERSLRRTGQAPSVTRPSPPLAGYFSAYERATARLFDALLVEARDSACGPACACVACAHPRADRAPATHVRALAEPGTFEGWCCRYQQIDCVDEVFEVGAFRNSIKANNRVKCLWAHERSEIIGHMVVRDLPEGVWGTGQLNLNVQRAREAYALIQAGDVQDLSVGFRTAPGGDRWVNGRRHITNAELMEVSLVAFGCVPGAAVQGVRHLDWAKASHRRYQS